MSWRQPYDVACPACMAGPGRLCREHTDTRKDIEVMTAKAINTASATGKLRPIRTWHMSRMAASLRGTKVPLA